MKKNILTSAFVLLSVFLMAQDFSIDSVPVRLRYLQASSLNNGNRLQWSVVCLLDFASFDIQRSTDGIRYTSIGKFQADKLRCKTPFEYEDKTASGKIFYRINVGDQDERYYTSKTVLVYGKEKGFDITSITPTLVTSSTVIAVSSSTNDQVELFIRDQNGNLVSRKNYVLQSGNNDLTINTISLSKGNYFIILLNKSGEKKLARFIKQ